MLHINNYTSLEDYFRFFWFRFSMSWVTKFIGHTATMTIKSSLVPMGVPSKFLIITSATAVTIVVMVV